MISGGCLEELHEETSLYFVYSDGACKGNPGPCAGGAVLYDASFNEIDTISVLFGIGTNNEAEYKAFIEGVKLCLRNNIPLRKVIFRMDSELLCKQLTGKYKVSSSNLFSLYEITQKFDIDFSSQIEHVYRHENKRADSLANVPFLS